MRVVPLPPEEGTTTAAPERVTGTAAPSHSFRPPLLGTWLERVDAEQAWLIRDFILREGIVLVSGPKKLAYKTWFAFAAALVIASGKAFNLLQPETQGSVLIIEEEGSSPQTKSRLIALCNGIGINPYKLPVYFSHFNRVKLDDLVWREKLLAFVDSVQPLVVVFDAFAYLHTGDENQVKDIAPLVDTLALLRSRGVTVIMLSHTNKHSAKKSVDIDDQVRGSGLLTDCYDIHLALRRYKPSQSYINLIVRGRDVEEKEWIVTWNIRADADGRAERAELNIHRKRDEPELKKAVDTSTPKEVQSDVTSTAQEYVTGLIAGFGYDARRLADTWQCTISAARSRAKLLTKRGELRYDSERKLWYP